MSNIAKEKKLARLQATLHTDLVEYDEDPAQEYDTDDSADMSASPPINTHNRALARLNTSLVGYENITEEHLLEDYQRDTTAARKSASVSRALAKLDTNLLDYDRDEAASQSSKRKPGPSTGSKSKKKRRLDMEKPRSHSGYGYQAGRSAGSKKTKKTSRRGDGVETFVLLKWVLLIILVGFCLLFGFAWHSAYGNNAKLGIFVMTYNLLVFFYHLHRRKRKKGVWEGSTKNSHIGLMFACHCSKVRALGAANISFIMYFIFFKLFHNLTRCVLDGEDSSCLFYTFRGLAPEVADLFTLVLFVYPLIFTLLFLTSDACDIIMDTHKRNLMPSLTILVCFHVFAGLYDAFQEENENILSMGIHAMLLVLSLTVIYYLPNKRKDQPRQERDIASSWMKKWERMTDLPVAISKVVYDILVIGRVFRFLGKDIAQKKFLKLKITGEEKIDTFTGCCSFWKHTVITGLFSSIYVVKTDTKWDLKIATLLPVIIPLILTVIWAQNIYLPEQIWGWISNALFVGTPTAVVLYLLPTWSMKVVAIAAGFCLYYRNTVTANVDRSNEIRTNILSIISALIFVGSFFFCFFLIFLTGLVTCVNSISTILLVHEDALSFRHIMKVWMFMAVFTTTCHVPKVFSYVVHKFNADEDLKNDMDEYYGMLSTWSCWSKHRETETGSATGDELEDEQLKAMYERCDRFPFLLAIIFSGLVILLGIYRMQNMHVDQVKTKSEYYYSDGGNSFSFQGIALHRENDTIQSIGPPEVSGSAIQRDELHTYSACSMRWRDLTVIDYALLSSIAYYYPDRSKNENYQHELDGMKQALEFSFPKGMYNVELIEDWDNEPRKSQEEGTFKKFFKFDFHDQKHTVIAVQGTNNLHDALADVRLGAVSAVIDFAQCIFFPLNFMVARNRAYMQWLMDLIQSRLTIEEGKLDFHAPVVKYVHSLLHGDRTRKYKTSNATCDADDCWKISVTGHSLGGGIATIVGSIFGIPSVSFSGFGSHYSKYQFTTHITGEKKPLTPKLRDSFLATTLVPSHDFVPLVDSHSGSVQHTVCSSVSPLACHSIAAMTCDLLYRCGDNQNQQRFKSCNGNFSITFDKDELENKLQG